MITERLARFVVETGVKDLPQDALKIAQMGITDFVGVTFPGSLEPHGKIMKDYATRIGGAKEGSVISGNMMVPLSLAAMVNGTMGHALDYDDMGGFGHPSVALAPVVLSVGEQLKASGADILAAYVIGFELACCLSDPLMMSHYAQGWHSTDNFGCLGAAAAAAWLLKLDLHQVRMALGISASLAGGLRQNFGTMTKPLHAGVAAANGIQAALLAQSGFTADENIIEAPFGFARVFGNNEEIDWEEVSKNLGKTFSITSPSFIGIAIKPYPACGLTHCGIDAAIFIMSEFGLNSEDIAEVELGINPFVSQVLIHHRPKTGLEGKFSLEYTVARALFSGEVKLKHLTDEGVNEPSIKNLIERMKWVEKYPMPAMGQRLDALGPESVTVKMKNGKEYFHEVTTSKGLPGNPLTPDEFKGKYMDCASTVLSVEDAKKSLNLLSNFPELPNIIELMQIIIKN